jgi:hypothetical protein
MERQLSNPAGHMFSSQYTVEYMPGGSEETNDERKEIKDFEQTRPWRTIEVKYNGQSVHKQHSDKMG